MINTVFKVIGYEIKTPEGNFVESCIFWVYAKSEKEALSKAKGYGVKKAHYQVLEVIEKIENVSP
jgi:hypothetical protein